MSGDGERGSDVTGLDILIIGDGGEGGVTSDDSGATEFGKDLEVFDGALAAVTEEAEKEIGKCAIAYTQAAKTLYEAIGNLRRDTSLEKNRTDKAQNNITRYFATFPGSYTQYWWGENFNANSRAEWQRGDSEPKNKTDLVGYGSLRATRQRLPNYRTDSNFGAPRSAPLPDNKVLAKFYTLVQEGATYDSPDWYDGTDNNGVKTSAHGGVFFPPYDSFISDGQTYVDKLGTGGGYFSTDARDADNRAAIAGYCLTMLNYYLELIVKQILIAQNLNEKDSQDDSEKFFKKVLKYGANTYEYNKHSKSSTVRYYAPDGLHPLIWGSYKQKLAEEKAGGQERGIFDETRHTPTSTYHPGYHLALFYKEHEILDTVDSFVDALKAIFNDTLQEQYHLAAIYNFISEIRTPAETCRQKLECIREQWDTVIAKDKEIEAGVKKAMNKHGLDRDISIVMAHMRQRKMKERDFTDIALGQVFGRNPERLFFKEQCFLLSYISQIAKHKQKELDVKKGVNVDDYGIEGLEGEEAAKWAAALKDAEEEGGGSHAVDRVPSKKLLPYLGYTGAYLTDYGPQSYNSTLLLDGDPYGFLNKLVSGNQEALLNIDHQVLSLLQPFIRLYKVEFEDDGTEKDIEIRFDSYRTSREAELFKENKLRNTGVGLKSFNFTYDGSNPFGARKSIKGTLKIFANTFDELMLERGKYKYADLALKTLNTHDADAIRRENENLAKLNFRLKAQVGWSVPDVATLDRMNLSEAQSAELRTALYASIVTLNLTPTVHDFEFDELGRVNFTINYLAYAEETYAQAKFNVFSEAEFAVAREKRELKLAHYTKKCKPESVSSIKKEFAKEASAEVSTSIGNLVSTLIELDRIYYINVPQDQIKYFISLGPFADLKTVEVLDNDTHHVKLQEDVATALKRFVDEAEKRGETVLKSQKGAISSALASTSPESTLVSFFYLSDLLDTILANIEREIALIPEQLEALKATASTKEYTAEDLDSKIREYRAYERSFRKLRLVLGPVEFVNPKEGKSIFVNLGDVPISVRYWFEWLTSTMLNKGKSYYSLTAFLNDFMNRMLSKFLNNSECFNYNIKQSVNMQQASYTGPQTASAIKKRKNGEDTPGYVIDPITAHCQSRDVARTHINRLDMPALKIPPNPVVKISSLDEVNYMIYFVGRTSPTEKMLGKKSLDEAVGIYHYQIGRDRGLVKDIKLKKTSTPGLQEVRFEQQGYAGLEQLRVTYDADIACYANPNTFPGTYIYVDPAGFSPSAKNSLDLTKYGIGGYYMVIRSTHNFAPAIATTEIEAKWVNAIHGPQDKGYSSLSTSGIEEEQSECEQEKRAAGVEEASA